MYSSFWACKASISNNNQNENKFHKASAENISQVIDLEYKKW